MNVYLRSLDDQTQFGIQEGENLLLGRLDRCDMVLEDGSVSSQHARLSLADGVLVVADLDSTNGTRVNYSLLVEPMALMDGDTVEFGNVSFIVDGPGLRTERPSVTDSAFVNDFKPLDLSEPLDATMQLSGFTEEEFVETPEVSSSVSTDLEAVSEGSEDLHGVSGARADDDRENKDDFKDTGEAEGIGHPAGRMLVTGLFFILFVVLMGLYLWRYVPAL